MSPARIYLIVSGILLLILAAVGSVISIDFPVGAEATHSAESGYVLGIFETNGWHNLAGLMSGSLAWGFAARPQWARLGALVKGFFYVGVTVSIAIWGGETFWIASNAADKVLHASIAVLGVATGLMPPSSWPAP